MRRNELIAVLLFLAATAGTIGGVFAVERYRRSSLDVVELIARAPEHGSWYPRRLDADYGKQMRILIRNIDTVSHGFAIPDLSVAMPEIKAGEVRVISFVPSKRGRFLFQCTVWCSTRHMEMRGELVVK